MKLLFKTSLWYIAVTVVVFIGGIFIFFYVLQDSFGEETNEKLEVQKELILKYIQKHDTLPSLSYESYSCDYIRPGGGKMNDVLGDTAIFSEEEEEMIPLRTLIFTENVDGQWYTFHISHPLFENDDIMEGILYSFIVVAAVLLILLLITNWIISRQLFKPFFRTMEELKKFRIDGGEEIVLSSTSTKEFQQLNEAIRKMTEKVRADYSSMKTFTENAAHELQTPLSVILAETEQLMQDPSLGEQQMVVIQSLNQSARKLSRLNQTLLLFAKISNRQFSNESLCDMSALVNNRAASFADRAEYRKQELKLSIANDIRWKLNTSLAEILLNNLFSNAVRHTPEGGKIVVALTANELSISNSGSPMSAPEKVFDRFYKENPSSESTGLGLALVKQICDSCELKLNYHYSDQMHYFTIKK